MPIFRLSGMAALLALAGLVTVVPALDAQEFADVQSQCRREAQDYGVEPEQIEDYVNGCVLAYGGMPAVDEQEPEAPPVDAGAEAPADGDQATGYDGEQDTDGAVE